MRLRTLDLGSRERGFVCAPHQRVGTRLALVETKRGDAANEGGRHVSDMWLHGRS